ncbi:TPA: two-component system sensor histidine kinase PhoQ [Shigella flexneri]|nr:two-component system sensor histidine kinase PhoQ [Shigella flexneri]
MRVLVVEDNALLRHHLKVQIQDAGHQVDDAEDAKEADYYLNEHLPDIAIVDLGLPDEDGLSLIRRWRSNDVSLPILVLTARESWQDKVEVLSAGADDYVTKPFHIEEVMARMQALMRRNSGLASQVISLPPFQVDLSRRELSINDEVIKLTAFEYTIMETLIRNNGKVVSKDSLMLQLYPDAELRVRFLLATAAVVLVLSLAYGMVALIGYSVSFDKTTFRLLRGESNLFYTLAKWENNKLHVELPENIDKQSPTMTLIYDENGQLLWAQRDVPWLMKMIQPDWLKSNGFHEIEADVNDTSLLLSGDHSIQQQLQEVREDDDDAEMTHSVAVNVYPATSRMPKLTIVVVDTIPVELKSSYMVWSWFIYVLSANLLLVIPLLWVAAWWSLRPIEALAKEVRELEEHNRELLNPATTRELTSLVRNLNRLLKSERERYDKYRTTLTDLTHSLKTPLAVLQSTLRSLRSEKMSVSDAEPVMLEQISRISQQIGYYLHRASMRGGTLLSRELHPVAPLLDNLTSALNKVYQRKGVNISLDISPEISFVGEQNDFVEVMGNVLDNACKYCLEFVEISARQTDEHLYIVVEDDGPGIPLSKREVIFDRGQRVDTLRPGQGVGLAVAREITEQYEGKIVAEESMLGGARMEVIFGRQHSAPKDE